MKGRQVPVAAFLLAAAAVFLASCATAPAVSLRPSGSLTAKGFLVAEVFFGAREFPAFPLIDAAAYSSAAAKIAAEAGAAQAAIAPALADVLAEGFSGRFKGNAAEVPNPFAANPESARAPDAAKRGEVATLISSSGTDFLIVALPRIVTERVGALGATGAAYLRLELFLYDGTGAKVGEAMTRSESRSAPPGDLASIKALLETLPLLASELVGEF